MERVDEVIGFLELAAWALAIVAMAAAITYAVIKLVPSKDEVPPGKEPTGGKRG
jgi:hypothetical protein